MFKTTAAHDLKTQGAPSITKYGTDQPKLSGLETTSDELYTLFYHLKLPLIERRPLQTSTWSNTESQCPIIYNYLPYLSSSASFLLFLHPFLCLLCLVSSFLHLSVSIIYLPVKSPSISRCTTFSLYLSCIHLNSVGFFTSAEGVS